LELLRARGSSRGIEIDKSAETERINKAGFAAFSVRADEGAPVVMLNLLSLQPDGGQERYQEYGFAVARLLETAGGRIVFLGQPAPALIGDNSWDLAVLVEYPSRRSFLEMVTSTEYQAIGHTN
jgi:uncharacterized protein (DUF1330 family)